MLQPKNSFWKLRAGKMVLFWQILKGLGPSSPVRHSPFVLKKWKESRELAKVERDDPSFPVRQSP
jgi:hypothetical protein